MLDKIVDEIDQCLKRHDDLEHIAAWLAHHLERAVNGKIDTVGSERILKKYKDWK
jgi:hypothetical protein